ncbi:MAG TPA: 4Fe-4S dicluster domain-containing protein [Nitrososphaerales archaeon]|nr:4Fe-4S dicluster domain-containing protein [Nitrososphaerales archaeon]
MPRNKIGGALGEMFRTALERPITEEYPFGKKVLTERFRGRLDIDPVKCTGCSVCEIVCPAGVITMVPVGSKSVGSRSVDVKRPEFDLYSCISCGQCVDDCRFGALSLTHDFELAVFDKESLKMRKALKSVK